MYVILDDCKSVLRQPHFESTRSSLVYLQTTGSIDIRYVFVFGTFGLVGELEVSSVSRQLSERVASIGRRSTELDARGIT